MKSLLSFHRHVNKALRSISHWLVSQLAFLLSIHMETASKLLYDVLYITINRKNEQVKIHNCHKYVKI